MRAAFHVIALALLMASGCSSVDKRGALKEEFARMSEDERTRVCANLYRDAKISCREGLHDEFAFHSYECLSARMKIDQFCLTPR